MTSKPIAPVQASHEISMRLDKAGKRAVSQVLEGNSVPQLCECNLGECRTNLLPLLYEMSRIVTEAGNLSTTLNILLQLMRRHMKVIRGMVSLYDIDSGKILSTRVSDSPMRKRRGASITWVKALPGAWWKRAVHRGSAHQQ